MQAEMKSNGTITLVSFYLFMTLVDAFGYSILAYNFALHNFISKTTLSQLTHIKVIVFSHNDYFAMSNYISQTRTEQPVIDYLVHRAQVIILKWLLQSLRIMLKLNYHLQWLNDGYLVLRSN